MDPSEVSSPLTENSNVNLILFSELDSDGTKKWGYLDGDTGTVIIEAKYILADPFVGDFAVVQVDGYTQKLINKDGKEFSVENTESVYLFTSKSGKITVAVIVNGTPYDEYYKYRMVNLLTGETIIPEGKKDLAQFVETVGDYFLVRNDLYQFLDNGDVKLVAENNAVLTAGILNGYFKRLGINIHVDGSKGFIDIGYWEYLREKYADPDLSGALNALKDLCPEFSIPFENAYPFFRDHRLYLNGSLLEINERKFSMAFKDQETGRYAIGIYNESKAEWELPPCFKNWENEEEWELFYITDIIQTNNPNLYCLHLKTDSIGWNNSNYFLIGGGGIYDAFHHKFIDDLYLSGGFSTYIWKSNFYLSHPYRFSIHFPVNGAYLFYDKNRDDPELLLHFGY